MRQETLEYANAAGIPNDDTIINAEKGITGKQALEAIDSLFDGLQKRPYLWSALNEIVYPFIGGDRKQPYTDEDLDALNELGRELHEKRSLQELKDLANRYRLSFTHNPGGGSFTHETWGSVQIGMQDYDDDLAAVKSWIESHHTTPLERAS